LKAVPDPTAFVVARFRNKTKPVFRCASPPQRLAIAHDFELLGLYQRAVMNLDTLAGAQRRATFRTLCRAAPN
jgi:hypothetical protein